MEDARPFVHINRVMDVREYLATERCPKKRRVERMTDRVFEASRIRAGNRPPTTIHVAPCVPLDPQHVALKQVRCFGAQCGRRPLDALHPARTLPVRYLRRHSPALT